MGGRKGGGSVRADLPETNGGGAAQGLKEFARQQIEGRLSRALFEMRRVRHGAGEEAVHDLRVSLRRFFAALRIFRDLFPRRHADRIRKELRLVLKLAGEVRNRDIALALAQEAGVGPRAAVTLGLHRQRKESVHVLKNALHQAESRDVAQRWRNGALA